MESRHRSRGLAPRALAQELRRKGIDDEDSKTALEQIDESDQRAAARALVDKKLRSMRGLDHQVATRRLAGLLARKGYAAGLAFSVVREALGEAEDDERTPTSELDRPPPLRHRIAPSVRCRRSGGSAAGPVFRRAPGSGGMVP